MPDMAEALELALARAIEVSDGEALQHGMIFRSPVGRDSERTPTPLRFFCLPFEDLLIAAPRQRKQRGRIARDSIAPIWTWLREILLPLETSSYCCAFKSAIAAGDHEQAKAHATDFWRIAGAALRAALACESGRSAARQVVKNELILADAEEVARLLSIAPAVMTIRDLMVRPVPVLTGELQLSLRKVHDGLVMSAPEAADYVAVIAMNRLARPWETLNLLWHTRDLVREIICDDIKRYAGVVREARYPDFDTDALLDNIAHFTVLYNGIFERNDTLGDRKLRRLLAQGRAMIALALEGFMRRAPQALAGALREPDTEKVELALRTVRLVVGCKSFATAGFLGASVRQAEEVMCRLLLRHNENLFAERNAGNSGRVGCATAVKLSSVLFGIDHGEFLRRRAAVGA
ncbi:MAG TPA: hypothetical protein VKT24_02595 [Rhizomicrobium sp.]|nr:hypothetical protein [Rhizomicrobium sp.]